MGSVRVGDSDGHDFDVLRKLLHGSRLRLRSGLSGAEEDGKEETDAGTGALHRRGA